MISFQEKATFDPNFGYGCTNEEPELLASMIRRCKIKKALSIASAGEIPLFILLPKAREKVVAVDHSIRSLSVFCLKLALIKELGAKGAKEWLSTDRQNNSHQYPYHPTFPREKAAELKHLVPEPLRPRFEASVNALAYEFNTGVPREWALAKTRYIAVSARKFDKLHLIHGDLTDAAEHGPFDFLYLSNALEHVNKTGQRLNGASLDPMLTSGAHILTMRANSVADSMMQPFPSNWEKVNDVAKGKRTGYRYVLYKKV